MNKIKSTKLILLASLITEKMSSDGGIGVIPNIL